MGLILVVSSVALGKQDWMDRPWRVKTLHCPFDCSDTLKNAVENAKTDDIIFTDEKAILPDLVGSCAPPAKPNWKSVQKIQLRSYLEKWTDNAAAGKQPKVRKNLAKEIGLEPQILVTAGIVSCADAGAFNFIYINPNKSMILTEENGYIELYRKMD